MKRIRLLDLVFVGAFFVLIIFFIAIFARSDRTIHIKIKVTDQDVFYLTTHPPLEYAYSFHPGDVERNEVGKEMAQLQHVTLTQSAPANYVTYLDIDLKANYNPIKKLYSYKGRPIIFGQDIEFDFANTKVDGIVVDFPGFTPAVKTPVLLTVTAQLRNDSRSFSDTYGMPKFYANVLKVGDQISDSQGQVFMKVTDIKVTPAKRTIVTQSNQSLTIDDQELVDIFYTLEVHAYEVTGKDYILDYAPILIGSTVPVVTNTVSLFPTIISFQKE